MTSLPLILVSCWVLEGATIAMKDQIYIDSGTDKTFTDNITFVSAARSQLHCALQCNQHDSCMTFTFHENTCKGYDVRKSSSSASTPATGARSFARENKTWLHKTCTADSQCPAVHSECFNGQCLCTPGYYYSISQNSCTTTCEEANLQSTLLEYTGSVIMGYDIYCVYTLTRAQCVDKCLHYSSDVCRTLDFRSTIQECCGHTVTPVDASDRWIANSTTYDFYQRMCA